MLERKSARRRGEQKGARQRENFNSSLLVVFLGKVKKRRRVVHSSVLGVQEGMERLEERPPVNYFRSLT